MSTITLTGIVTNADGSTATFSTSTALTPVLVPPPPPPPVVTPPPVTGTFPTASTTGVPAGTVLTPSPGVAVHTNGLSFNAVHFTGTVDVYASNVVFTNCLFDCSNVPGAFYCVDTRGSNGNAPGVVFRRCTFIGPGAASKVGTMGIQTVDDGTGVLTVDSCDISLVEHGVHYANGTVHIVNNFIHNILSVSGSHYDGLFTGGAMGPVLIQNNTIEDDNNNLTSCCMIQNVGGPCANITVTANLMKCSPTGGAYTLYVDNTHSAAAVNGPTIAITNNACGRGQFGYFSIRVAGVVDTGNYDYATKAPIS